MAELNICFASLFGPPCKWFSIIEPESISILVMGVFARVGEHRKVFFRSTCDGGGDVYYDYYDYYVYYDYYGYYDYYDYYDYYAYDYFCCCYYYIYHVVDGSNESC